MKLSRTDLMMKTMRWLLFTELARIRQAPFGKVRTAIEDGEKLLAMLDETIASDESESRRELPSGAVEAP